MSELLADPAAKAILDARLPGLSTNPQIGMVSGMSLRTIQQFAPDQISEKALNEIDADFAKAKGK